MCTFEIKASERCMIWSISDGSALGLLAAVRHSGSWLWVTLGAELPLPFPFGSLSCTSAFGCLRLSSTKNKMNDVAFAV